MQARRRELLTGGQTAQDAGGSRVKKAEGFRTFRHGGRQRYEPGKVGAAGRPILCEPQQTAELQRIQHLMQYGQKAAFIPGKRLRHAQQIQLHIRVCAQLFPGPGEQRQRHTGGNRIAQIGQQRQHSGPIRRQLLDFPQKGFQLRRRAGFVERGTERPFDRFPVCRIGKWNTIAAKGGKQEPVRFSAGQFRHRRQGHDAGMKLKRERKEGRPVRKQGVTLVIILNQRYQNLIRRLCIDGKN